MSPADAIAQPFIERDFETPSYDRKLALDRIRTRQYKRKEEKARAQMSRPKRRKIMERLTSRDDTACRTRYIPEPGVKNGDLLQRLGRCEETLVWITYCVKRVNDGRSATECIAEIRMALRALDADTQKERPENG